MKASHEVAEATSKVAKAHSYHVEARRALAELQATLSASDGWQGYSQAQHDLRRAIRSAVAAQQVEVDARLAAWNAAEAELVRAEYVGHTVLVGGFKASRVNLYSLVNAWYLTIGEHVYTVDAGAEAGDVWNEVRFALAWAVDRGVRSFPGGYDSSMLDELTEDLVESLLTRSGRIFV